MVATEGVVYCRSVLTGPCFKRGPEVVQYGQGAAIRIGPCSQSRTYHSSILKIKREELCRLSDVSLEVLCVEQLRAVPWHKYFSANIPTLAISTNSGQDI